MKKIDYYTSSDGHSKLYYAIWEPEGEIKATLQIIHGMSEYVDRYEHLAEYLNGFGILVAGNDIIGHGHSAEKCDYGYFDQKDGWLHMLEDADTLRGMLEEKYSEVPAVMLGHSMGSFLIRCYLGKYGQKNLSGAIIEGTCGENPALAGGAILAKTLRALKGGRSFSPLLVTMSVGSYTNKIPNAKTGSDWLSKDENVVNAYVADPMCGFPFTLGGYVDLFEMMKYMGSDECYGNHPKSLPTLIMSGEEDPVGNYCKGPIEVEDKLKAAGCEKLKLKLYEGMRHELHNEIGKEQPIGDMRDFILDCAGCNG